LQKNIVGKVKRVVGPLLEIESDAPIGMLDMIEVGEDRLIGEIVHIKENSLFAQIYEDTTGIKAGTHIISEGGPLSVELGPGLLGTIYDGIQRPLEVIRNQTGHYIKRGFRPPALDRNKKWHFKPTVLAGATLSQGSIIGTVPETEIIEHRIMLPPGKAGLIKKIKPEGEYTIEETIAVIENQGKDEEIKLYQKWPVRKSRPYTEKMALNEPLLTGQRVIDTLFPVAKGGTVIIPGGFGTGKTMIQHAIAKWCDAHIIVYIGCGERGNEITDVLMEFPKLIDPHSKKPLMQRTLLIANTSNMPVAAREASIYTGITLAEYYRDMGYHVAIMADSTSRWAEALRELSGRMEEMPAEEGFPAYLPTRLAEFYERAGFVTTLDQKEGSISIIGAVSPPGGDFSEPVTQHSKRFVRSFWALDRHLANARHYPSISWTESYSGYIQDIAPWWEENIDPDWKKYRRNIIDLLQQENKLQQVVKLIGEEVLPDSQKLILETCRIFKNTFLQQNAFDDIDKYCTAEKQIKMLKLIITFYQEGKEALNKGVTILRLKRTRSYREIIKMKFTITNEDCVQLDNLSAELKKELNSLGALYEKEF